MPDRAAAFPSNTWEYVNARRDRGDTYYLPINEGLVGRDIDVYVLGYDVKHVELSPVAWLVPNSTPPEGAMLELRGPGRGLKHLS